MSALDLPGLPRLPALVGAAALALAGVLSLWATPRWLADAAGSDTTLRQRARAAAAAPPPARPATADQRLVQALPPSADLPGRIRALVQVARQQGLQLDSLRQQPPQRLGQGPAALDAEQVPLRLTGSGPYSAWRRLVADALQQDDALVLTDLRLARNNPADRNLGGTLQWALLQRPAQGANAGPAAAGGQR